MEESKQRLLEVIKHLRYAAKQAAAEGKVELGILAVKPDGGGQIIVRMEAGDFIEDIAKVIGAPDPTTEDEEDAKAFEFLSKHGLG